MVILTAALVLVGSPAALADPAGDQGNHEFTAEANTAPGSVDLHAGVRTIDLGHVSSGQARSVSAPVCVFRFSDDRWQPPANVEALVPDGGYLYWIVCHEGQPNETGTYHIYGPTDPGETAVAAHPTRLIQDAFDRISTAAPTLTLSPGIDGYQLTGLPTFLAIDRDAWDAPPTGSVTAAGGDATITVTAWLEPRYVLWDLGTGDTLECDGPGNTYTEGVAFVDQTIECPYVFTTRPADLFGDPAATSFPITATLEYDARYRIDGLPGAGTIEASAGTVTGPPATGQQEVRELRATLTTNP